jgi:hypothetical protein
MYFICILYVFLDSINLAKIIFFENMYFVCILYVFLKHQKFSKHLSLKIHTKYIEKKLPFFQIHIKYMRQKF